MPSRNLGSTPMFHGNGLPMRRVCAAAWFVAALFSFVSAAHAQSPVTPPASATARVWFYQDQNPYVSMNYATVSMNGVVAASVQPYGGAIYRDVPAGHYHLTSDTAGMDVNQSADVDLMPGQEVYVKIMSLPDWATANLGSFRRNTFYLRPVATATARAELTQH
jgi:hypothetical protein